MKWYHTEVLKTLKERNGLTDAEILRHKKALETYTTDEEREEYLKGVIWQLGQTNRDNREFRKWW
jgi:hypothetical protein